MNVLAMTLDADHVLARYDRQIVDGQHAVLNLLLDDVRRRRAFDRHLRVSCTTPQR